MASFDFDPTSRNYHVRFRYAGKPYKRSLKLSGEDEARRVCASVDEMLDKLRRGWLEMPADADPGLFLTSGGKVTGKPKPAVSVMPDPADTPMTLGRVFQTYQETLTPGSKERNTLNTEATHARHFNRVLGEGRVFQSIEVDTLQEYVNARSKAGIARDTITKELATLRAVWQWAFKRKHVALPLAWKMNDLTLPKSGEKPPFQTWDEITRKINRAGLSPESVDELWESLWLNVAQTKECLAWVKENAADSFIHPMFAFAAYTAARRSEIIRSERDDWDFEAGVVTLREKKADKSKNFTRRSVPINSDLAEVMKAWFERQPGTQWAISTEDGEPINGKVAWKKFRQTVESGKWKVLRGWHTFRHSLASNLAIAGTDQREISGILGHHTEEMERRYRHLCPKKQEQTLHALFRDKVAG